MALPVSCDKQDAGTEIPATPPSGGMEGEVLPDWQEGWLDIHFINGGRGESTYYILPDGTTMLIDAAGAPPNEISEGTGVPSRPSCNISCGKVIIDYIRHFSPKVAGGKLDYFMASHYHGDHIGAWRDSWQSTYGWTSYPGGGFVVNGLPEVGTQIPISKVIDRGDWGDAGGRASQDYFDEGGRKRYDNYIKFLDWSARVYGTRREALQVGRSDQICLVHNPSGYQNFAIRNLAASGDFWTGSGDGVTSYMPTAAQTLEHAMEGDWAINENIYSCAIHLRYGMFDWVSAGDSQYSGRSSKSWKDSDTPIGRAVGRKIEAMKASHHSTKNANSPEMLGILKPDVVLAGVWQSVQPNPSTVANFRAANPDVKFFVTNITDENLSTLKTDGGIDASFFQSLGGHVVIRVAPSAVRYWVFVLDDTNQDYIIKSRFGPYGTQ